MVTWIVILGLVLIVVYDVAEQRKWEQLARQDRRQRAAQKYFALHGHLQPGFDADGNEIEPSAETLKPYTEQDRRYPATNK